MMGPDRPGLAAFAALLGLFAATLGGCTTGDSGVEGPVAVYVSLPLSGPFEPDGRDAADGARLALDRAGGRAGDLEVRATYLDDAGGSVWDPVAVGRNARRAAQDSSTAAYIGELSSEPTRASAPITNDAGIVQVSPGATAVDLTAPADGYSDTPDRYRPSGDASFARVVPDDADLLSAAAESASERKLAEVGIELGEGPFAKASTREFKAHADEVGVQTLEGSGGDATLSAQGAGFALESGGDSELFEAPLAPTNLPGKSFAREFADRFGREPGPYGAYGYEAMWVVLEAIGGASDSDGFRASVVDGVLDSEHPDSVLGVYSITSDGDTTLCAVQPYELGGGAPQPLAPVCPRG